MGSREGSDRHSPVQYHSAIEILIPQATLKVIDPGVIPLLTLLIGNVVLCVN